MDFPVKPPCYDSKPPCLCMKCYVYDYECDLLSRPALEFSLDGSSSLSTRPSSTVAVSTCGLVNIDVPPVDSVAVQSSCSVESVAVSPARPSCPAVSVAVSPVCSSPVEPVSPVCPSVDVLPARLSCPAVSVAVSPVCSSPVEPVAVSPVRPSVDVSPVCSSPVTSFAASYVQPSRPISSVAVSSASPPSCPVSSGPPRVWPRPVLPSRPVSPVAAPCRLLPSFRSPVFSPVVRPPLLPSCSPFFPLACFVLVMIPVLLPTPFGLVVSFLPVLR